MCGGSYQDMICHSDYAESVVVSFLTKFNLNPTVEIYLSLLKALH